MINISLEKQDEADDGSLYQLLRWRVSEIIGCVYELAIYGSTIWMVWDLQTKRKTKTVVLMMFGFRLLLVT